MLGKELALVEDVAVLLILNNLFHHGRWDPSLDQGLFGIIPPISAIILDITIFFIPHVITVGRGRSFPCKVLMVEEEAPVVSVGAKIEVAMMFVNAKNLA